MSRLVILLPYLVIFLNATEIAYGKTYILKNVNSGKCIDVPAASKATGEKLQQWDCNDTVAQKFELIEVDGGTTTPPPVTPPPKTDNCSALKQWVAGASYKAGEKVVFEGQIFTAAHENPGYNPKVSTWFWTAGDKCGTDTVTNPPPVTPPPVTPPPTGTPNPNPSKEIAAYLQSWSCSWVSQAAQHCIATVPRFIDTILLSFVRPETSYAKGSKALYPAGLDFSADFDIVRDAIAIARGKGQTVLLSVGGATYHGWANLNAQGLKNLADDLGVDGIDIDWEGDQVCSWGTGGTSCPKDGELAGVIKTLRAAFPSPKLLTAAVWSTGAFGPAPYQANSFKGNLIGGNFGSFVNPLKANGSMLDKIYIMSYDAGGPNAPAGSPTGYSPKLAYEAYKALYKGPVIIGIEGGQQAWGGHVTNEAEAADLAKHSGSAFFWSLQKAGTMELMRAACRALGKSGCDQAAPVVSASPEKNPRAATMPTHRSEFHITTKTLKK